MKKITPITPLFLAALLTLAPISAMAEDSARLIGLVQGVVKTMVDLIYEFNPSLPDTIKGNALTTIMDQQVRTMMDNLSLNLIRYQLSNYIGFHSMHHPIDPQKTKSENEISTAEETQTYEYLNHLKNTNNLRLLNPPKNRKNPPLPTNQGKNDTYTLIQKTRAALRMTQPFVSEKGIPLPNPMALLATADEKREHQKLLAPEGLKLAFSTLLRAQRNCPPFPPKEVNKKEENQYPDCKVDIEGKQKIEQKMLHAMLQGGDNLYDNRQSGEDTVDYAAGDRHYSVQSLIQPLSYSTPAQKEAAEGFIASIKRYSGTPPTRPPELPATYTPEQMKAVMEQMAKDRRAKKERTFMDSIEMSQQAYMDGVRSLLAAQDLAMSNLYHVYAERTPQKSLRDQGITVVATNTLGIPMPKVIESPLELKAYLAQRRLRKSFLEKMAKASPTTIARETLSVMSEIRSQLFENQQTMNRMLVAFTLMQLTPVQAQGKSLSEHRRIIQRKIDELLTGKAGENEKFAPSDGSAPDAEALSESVGSELTGALPEGEAGDK